MALAPRSTRRVARLIGSATLVFALFGCRTQSAVNLAEGPRTYSPGDYDSVLKAWTRDTRLLSTDEMDNVLTVTATFESWDFRWAYAERYARDYRLGPTKKEQFRQRSLDEAQEYRQFYVALYAQHPKWGDLEVKEPAWVVHLVDSTGTETIPAKMDRIRKPGPREETYFPYTSSFRTVYRVSFPRALPSGKQSIAESAEWFALRFAGAQGTADVIWNVE